MKAATLLSLIFSATVASSCLAATPATPEKTPPKSEARAAAQLRIAADGYEVVKKQIAYPKPAHYAGKLEVFENIIVFSDSRVRIPLSRSAAHEYPKGRIYRTGYDPKSLKLAWLQRGSLLHVSWRTISVGQGGYVYHGDVIISLRGETGTEVYREFFLRSGHMGWSYSHWTTCDIQYDPAKREVQVILERTNSIAHTLDPDKGAPSSFSIRAGDLKGKQFWKRKTRWREVNRYLLSANRLNRQRIDASFEILKGQGRPSDIARYLLRKEYVSRSVAQGYTPPSAEEIKSTAEDLLRMNPGMRESDQCLGAIALPLLTEQIITTGKYDGAFGLAK
jgi:hypothetical protein